MRPIKLLITFLLYFVKRKTSEELVVEHSRNYHLLDDQDKWDKLFGHWNKLHRERRATEYLTNEKIRSYVNSFRPAFEAASTAIKALIKNCVLTGRIKSTASIAEKVKRKGVTIEDLTDIIGFRLTCQTVDMCLDGLSLFESGHPKFETLEKECYGMCPGKDKYRDTGYRRIHLILQIKPENKTFELQIGTPYTNMWSDWNHDFIYKGPTYIAQDQDAQNYSMALAEYFWKLDEVRRNIPLCPVILKESKALDVLKAGKLPDIAEPIWMKLGKPPSLCFWWNDMKTPAAEKKSQLNSHAKTNRSLAVYLFLILSLAINFVW